MKDFFGAFSSEFLRPLATLILPGLLMLVPYAILAFYDLNEIASFTTQNHAEAVGAICVLSIFLGLVLEDIGAQIEQRLYKRLCKRDSKFSIGKDWYPYLKISFSEEPVGQRYLRTLVMRLKFELGCVPAALFAILGVCLLRPTWCMKIGTIMLLAVFGAYMLFEASESIEQTALVRLTLVDVVPTAPKR